ncbi:GIY-YIG nuclease family protein [Priestia aryabhattai]|uniref:phage lytic cycle repressor MrpR family protein n=1 Tax=Priestia aryabhattai TaxID=412384 RepID=UPI003D2CC433
MKKKGIVYTITNKSTGKIYFGETTRDGEKRINEHRLALTRGSERNKALQKEYSEIGGNGFAFEVIIETKEYKLCELVLLELFSRIGLGYKQRRGDGIQKVINGEVKIPEEVYESIENYISLNFTRADCYPQLLSELKDIRESEFKCKSKDIYNREFKNLFWVGYSNDTRRVDEVRFKKARRFEEKVHKDLYDFTFEEAEEFLYSLNAKSLMSIRNQISRLRKYLEFAIQQGCSVNKNNYYKGLGNKVNASKYLKF